MVEGFEPERLARMLSSISAEDMKSLEALASELFTDTQPPPQSNEAGGADPQLVSKILSLMTKISSRPETPGAPLLRALKPMLSPSRRERVDTAIQLLEMITLLPLIKEL